MNMFKKKYIIIALMFFYKNNFVNCSDDYDFDDLAFKKNDIKNEGTGGKIKIIKTDKKNPKDDSVKNLFKLLHDNGYKNFNKKENFDPEGCKNLYEFLNNTDTKRWENFGNFINSGAENKNDIQQKTDNLKFLIEHPGAVNLLDSNLDDLQNIKNDFKNLSSDITTKPIADAYNAILSSKEIVDMLKDMDKKSLMKLNDILKLYSTVDIRDRTCVEGKLVSSYESFIYYTCGRKFFTMFKNNQKDIVEFAKTKILPMFKEYTNSVKQVLAEIMKNKKNKESIDNLKEELKKHTDIIKDRIKKVTEDYGGDKVKDGIQRKVVGYKRCYAKPKEVIT